MCKAHVKGFDHHCPAFGNCIGNKYYLRSIVLPLWQILYKLQYNTFQNFQSYLLKAAIYLSGFEVDIFCVQVKKIMFFSLFFWLGLLYLKLLILVAHHNVSLIASPSTFTCITYFIYFNKIMHNGKRLN